MQVARRRQPDCKSCGNGNSIAAMATPASFDEFMDGLLPQLARTFVSAGGLARTSTVFLPCATSPASAVPPAVRTALWTREGRRHRGRRRSVWPTGSSPFCAAKVTWHCCWSAPMCTSAAAPAGAMHAGRRGTLLLHPGVIDELAATAHVDANAFRAPVSSASSITAGSHCNHGRGRRRIPAQPAAPRPPCRGVSHPGPRCRRRPERRAGRRRPERAGDAVLRVTTRWCWSRLKNRHRETRNWPSLPTASWVAWSWAMAVTWTSSSSLTTMTNAPPRSMPPCAQADQLADRQDRRR
jgi:glutamate-ammonia-ligase adenylyltransferase